MAWVESHTVLLRHRKVIELAKDLRIKPVYVVGHLHVLWHAVLEQQEDGDLSSWSDDFIAESSGYQGNAPQFVSLLQKHTWLDGRVLHDWLDYAGKYLESKYRTANPERLAAIKLKHSQTKDGLKTDFSQTLDSPPNQPNLTIPNQLKNQPKSTADYSKEFIYKAEKAKEFGFNIYQMIGFFYKQSKLREKLPEAALILVLNEVLNRHEVVKDPFPYFLTVLKSKSGQYFSGRNQEESNKIKNQPSSLKEILAGAVK
jgi:hypothetical protein